MIIKPKYYGPAIPSTYAVALTAAAQPGIEIADDADIDMGTNDFGLIIYANFTDWTPASDTVLWEKHDGTNGVRVTLLTTGILRTTISATDFDASVATGLAASASAILTISVVRESASVAGSVTRYAGVDPIGTASAITAGAPTTVSNAVSAYVGGDGSNQQAGNYIQVVALNFAPTAADVRTVCTTGIPESWKWGSQASAVSGSVLNGTSNRAFSTFSSGADNFTGTTLAGDSSLNYAGYSIGVSPGQKIRVKGSFSITGTLGSAAFRINIATSLSNSAALSDTITVSGTSGDFDVVLTATVSATGIVNFSLGTSPVTDATITVTNIAINRQGATLALLPNTIPTSGATAWDDSSGNTGGGTLPAAGATKVTIRK